MVGKKATGSSRKDVMTPAQASQVVGVWMKQYTDKLEDTSENVRVSAADRMGDLLETMLGRVVTDALAKSNIRNAIEALTARHQDTSAKVRLAATNALSKIPIQFMTVSVMEALAARLKDTSAEVRSAADQAFIRIGRMLSYYPFLFL